MPDILLELPPHLRIPVSADVEPPSRIQRQTVLLQTQNVVQIRQEALMDPNETIPFQRFFAPGQSLPDEDLFLRAVQQDFVAIALNIQDILLLHPDLSLIHIWSLCYTGL